MRRDELAFSWIEAREIEERIGNKGGSAAEGEKGRGKERGKRDGKLPSDICGCPGGVCQGKEKGTDEEAERDRRRKKKEEKRSGAVRSIDSAAPFSWS